MAIIFILKTGATLVGQSLSAKILVFPFHHAPLFDRINRQQKMVLARWIEEVDPTAVIVDESVEIIQYLRLLGVPVIAIRQHGDRSDFPHLCGYSSAYKLLAPFPKILESSSTSQWAIDRTIYVPGFSRYSLNNLSKGEARAKLDIQPQHQIAVVLNGKSKGRYLLSEIAAAATASPEWIWFVVGQVRRDCSSLPANLSVLGWRKDIYVYLKAADIAIASGEHNTMMEIGTAKTPFLCIPDDKPFEEQRLEAELLESFGLCLVLDFFPQGDLVGSILNRVRALNVTKWEQIMSVSGAAVAASNIESEVKLLNLQANALKIECHRSILINK